MEVKTHPLTSAVYISGAEVEQVHYRPPARAAGETRQWSKISKPEFTGGDEYIHFSPFVP